MDEILSSIRQIIADDETPGETYQNPPVEEEDADPADSAGDAMPLSAEQIVADEDNEDSDFVEAVETDELEVTLSDDLAEGGADEAAEDSDELLMTTAERGSGAEEPGSDEPETAVSNEALELVVPDDIAFDAIDLGAGDAESEPSPGPAAAMPDPQLSSRLADKLLEPAATAAVQQTFARLNKLYLGKEGLTIENMVREMLRPMLKEWLDENLPTLVERMVEKEIERVSRGS
jgi:hypothetical protein